MEIIDFDNIDGWAFSFEKALTRYVSDDVRQTVSTSNPEFIEDALDTLFDLTDRVKVIYSVLKWIESKTIIGYHGTRLTEEEVSSVLSVGLKPLRAEDRKDRLLRALSKHPNWSYVEGRLDEAIEAYGNGNSAGHREGQVHLTLSQAALIDGFNHYLTHGSEFDQHVAHELLGEESKNYLAKDGSPILFQIAVPGEHAIKAAHPYFSVDDIIGMEEVPNIAKEFLRAWAFYLTDPSFRPGEMRLDCGMIFYSTVPSDWILNKNTLQI